MTGNKFTYLLLIPYLFIISLIGLAVILAPMIYKGFSTPQELRIQEFPFRFEVPEIKKPIIPSALNPPFRIVKRDFPKVDLQTIAPPPSATPSITLIMVSEDMRLAIINGLVLREGDSLGNGRILRIRDDAVVFSEGGRLREIPVPPPPQK